MDAKNEKKDFAKWDTLIFSTAAQIPFWKE